MKGYGRRICLTFLICFTYWPREVFLNYQYPSVFWTPKNCRFNLNKKEPKSAYEFSVKPFGKVYFICPNIALWSDMSDTGPRLSMMYENLMLVDKEGYETCTVNRTRNYPKLNRMLLRCDKKADELTYVEETFSPARASLHQMEYYSGETYYFISTSNGTKESLDNLSGGHCKTHHMKLKITVCGTKGPCPFNMPKCPYSYVFYEKYTSTTTSSTHAPTKPSTISSNNTPKATTKSGPTTETREETATEQNEVKPAKRNIKTSPKTQASTRPKAAELSSEETIWGTSRKHIIIHITMGLLILILTLSLIYILITRRKQKESSYGQGYSSKLYQKRPMSTNMELNGTPNGDARIV